MKKILLVLAILILSVNIFAQTNTFPTTGSVGIGTISPLYKLELKSGGLGLSGGSDTYLEFNSIYSATNFKKWRLAVGGGNSYFAISNHNDDGSHKSTPFYIGSNGNVGIGTTTPSAPFHIMTTSNPQARIGYNEDNFLELGHRSLIKYGVSGVADDFIIGLENENWASGYGNLLFNTDGLTRLAILENGNITASGDLSLYGAGSKTLRVASSVSTSDSHLMLSVQESTTQGLHLWHDASYGLSYIDNLYNDDSGDIVIRTKVSGTPINALTISGNGNITASGEITATKFIGDGSRLTGISGSSKWTDGTDGKIYYNEGNVGIGTTNPEGANLTKTLHIKANVRPGIRLESEYSANAGDWEIYADAGSTGDFIISNAENNARALLIGKTTNDVQIQTNSEGTYFNKGKVGIGTITPGTKLDVVGGSISIDNSNGQYEIRTTGGQNGDALWAGGGDFLRMGNDFAWNGIYFMPGSTIKATLLKNGNFGIGTTTPSAKLDVNGNIKAVDDSYIYWGNPGESISTAIRGNRDSSTPANSYIDLLVNTESALFIDGSRNITASGEITATKFIGDGSELTGIGGSSKWIDDGAGNISYNNGNITASGNMILGTGVPESPTGVNKTITVSGTTASIGLRDTDTGNIWEMINTNDILKWNLEGVTGLQIDALNNITASGNMILGAGVPESPTGVNKTITVSGTTASIGLRDTDTGNIWEMINTNDILKWNLEGVTGLQIDALNNLTASGEITATKFIGDGSGLTGINGSSKWSDGTAGKIYYNEGNVGIGTTTPGEYKLAVNGNIKTKEVNVTMEGWSDFVFEDDYNLRSLVSVENYIKENKHLPEMPTEKEVLENGVAVGEMQAKLLQKIEELTLYMIEQNEESSKLKVLSEKLIENSKKQDERSRKQEELIEKLIANSELQKATNERLEKEVNELKTNK